VARPRALLSRLRRQNADSIRDDSLNLDPYIGVHAAALECVAVAASSVANNLRETRYAGITRLGHRVPSCAGAGQWISHPRPRACRQLSTTNAGHISATTFANAPTSRTPISILRHILGFAGSRDCPPLLLLPALASGHGGLAPGLTLFSCSSYSPKTSVGVPGGLSRFQQQVPHACSPRSWQLRLLWASYATSLKR